MENGKGNSGSNPKGRPRVVVVGSGFAGFTCARELERKLRPEVAELVLASPRDYLLYSPLLPEVATGLIDPRHIAVPLHGVLKRTRIILGDTTGVDLDARTCTVRPPNAPERAGTRVQITGRGVVHARPRPPAAGAGRRLRRPRRAPDALHLRGGWRRVRRHRVYGADAALHQEGVAELPAPCAPGPALDATRQIAAGVTRARRAPGRLPSVCSGGEGSRSGSRPP